MEKVESQGLEKVESQGFEKVESQDWQDEGYQWVDSRIATATGYIVENIKDVMLKSYFSSAERFDTESFKIDFTKFVGDKNDADLAERMSAIRAG